MKITVMYLGGSREISRCPKEIFELPKSSKLNALKFLIHEKYPELKHYENSLRWACNFEFATENITLNPNDEIALIPPVAGGSPHHLQAM